MLETLHDFWESVSGDLVRKDDLENFVTKDDLKLLVTKEDLELFRQEMKIELRKVKADIGDLQVNTPTRGEFEALKTRVARVEI